MMLEKGRTTVVFKAIIGMVCWACLTLPALAQGVGAIGGIVRDDSGAVLPGATVTLSAPGLIGGNQTTVTNGTGAYEFTRLVPATYSVKAELQGFRSVVQESILVNADQTSRADLSLAVGNVEETITVSGQSPLLDTTSALNQAVMTRDVLDALPMPRDVFNIAKVAPGFTTARGPDVGGKDSMLTSGTVRVHGSTGSDQAFMVDGMDMTSYSGGLSFTLDSFAFQEINYQGGNLPADKTASGVVSNMITRTGTNTFHGAAMFIGTPGWQADNYPTAVRAQLLAGVPAFARAANPNIEPGQTILHMFESGFSMSGPVIRDRIWFMGSSKLSEVDSYRVGSYNADGTQLLDDNQLRQLTGKGSWAVNTQNQVHFTYGWVHKGRYHQAGGPTVTEFFDTAASFYNPSRNHLQMGRWTNVLSSRLVMDAAAIQHYGQTNRRFQPGLVKDGDIPRFDSITRINTVAPANGEINEGRRAQIASSVSYSAGTHDLRVGYQFTRTVNTRGNYSSSHAPAGLRAVYRNGLPDSVNTYNTPTRWTPKTHEHALYLQDRWRAAAKLTLNFGFRFETLYGWINNRGEQLCQVQTIFVQGQCFPAVEGVPDWKSPTVRSSAAYDLRGDGRTALKFSANTYRGIVQGRTIPDQISPIRTVNDTRAWTVCATGQTSGCDLNGDRTPQLNELGPSTGFNLGTTNRYADDLTWPKVFEASTEIEQQLMGNMVFSAAYYYRKTYDLIGSRNLAVPTASYTPLTVTEVSSGRTVTVYNQNSALRGRFDVVFDNSDVLDARAHAVDLVVQKRMSNRWMLMASLSTVNNETYIFGTSDLNNPNFQFGRGPSDTEIPYMVKASGAYILPSDINLALSYQHYAGWPDTNTVLVTAQTARLTQVNQEVVIEPRGTTDLPAVRTLDFTLGKTVRFGGIRLEPRFEMFNLLNEGVITRRVTQLGSAYGNAIDYLGGRLMKAGFNMSW